MSERGKWKRRDLPERLAAKTVPAADSDCWHWTGSLNAQGYGLILPNGSDRRVRVHRVAYELHAGPIPDGMTLDHLCHTRDLDCPRGPCIHRRCVNPAHLEPVTRGENVRRGLSRITHCPQGHEYVPENTYRRADGGRDCRTCVSIRGAAAYRRRREAITV